MPTKRRRIAPRAAGISAAAIEAWRTGDFHQLNRALGIRPWQCSPLNVTGPTPPKWVDHGSLRSESWSRAWRLRQALIEAAGPPGRVGRHGDPLGPAPAKTPKMPQSRGNAGLREAR